MQLHLSGWLKQTVKPGSTQVGCPKDMRHGGTKRGNVRIIVISLNQQIDDLVKGQRPRASKLGRQDGPSVQTMAAGTNDSCTAEQTSSSNFEEEDVAAAVSLLEFCANLEDYTPTVSSTCTCTI